MLGMGSLASQRLDEWLHLRFGKASQPIHHIGFLQLDQILLVIRCGFGKIRVGSYRRFPLQDPFILRRSLSTVRFHDSSPAP